MKAYSFTWDTVSGATFYRFFEDPDGPGPLPAAHVGGDLTSPSFKVTHTTLLHERLNALYSVSACNAIGCSTPTATLQPDLVKAIGYFKASNTRTGHFFGAAVALSMDGTTLAVGATGDDSGSAGINQPDTTTPAYTFVGAVHVYVRDAAGIWSRQAYLKARNPGQDDAFGAALAISADGNTLAVGAVGEDSAAEDVNSTQENDNSELESGAVYVFGRSPAGTWSQQAYVKASNTDPGDWFGMSVALSGDGNTLAVGAPAEKGDGTDEDNNDLDFAGAVYVYVRSDSGVWSGQKYLKPSNPQVDGEFGQAVALSANGDILAVGSDSESTSNFFSGAVYMFTRNGTTWTEQQIIKASNAGEGDYFGTSVALSANGDTLAVGAPREASRATGINGNKANDDFPLAGAVYVYFRMGATWAEQAYVKASNTAEGSLFGTSVALSADGSRLAVGAPGERSNAKGINGNELDISAAGSGAVYLFTRPGSNWSPEAYVKASNTRVASRFGTVHLSGNGMTLAVGAYLEDSRATRINGDQDDFGGNQFNAGAVYLY